MIDDSAKTKAQLLEEVESLRSRLVEFKVEPAASIQPRRAPTLDPAHDDAGEIEHIYRTAPVGLCLLDRNLCYVRINERLAAINGRPVSDHLGRSLREVVPQLAPKAEPIYRQVIKTGAPVLDYEVHGTTPASSDQEGHWVVSHYPVKSPDGTVVGVSTVVQDITEQKRIEAELRQAQNKLERRVHERTAELQAANETLHREITERKRAQEALGESEQRFRSIFEKAAAGMVTVSMEGRFTQVNPAFCKFTGYSEAELLTLTVPEITHPGDREETLAQFDEVRAGQRRVIDLYKRLVKKDGATVWAHVSAAFLSGSDGAPAYSIALVQDITAHQHAEDALRSVVEGTSKALGEEFFRSLVRNLATALDVRLAFVAELHPTIPKRARLLAMWDESGFAKPFEYDVMGTPCEDVFAEDLAYYPHGVQERFPRDHWLQESGIDSYLAVPLNDREGNPIGHLGVMHPAPMLADLPRESILRVFAARAGAELERKQIEGALGESEERFRSVAESAKDGIILADGTARILSWNQAAQTIFGYSEEEVLGKPLTMLMPERYRQRHTKGLERYAQTGEASVIGQTVELDGLRKDGSEFPLELSLSTWKTAAGEFYCGIVRDITERKQIEATVRESERQSREQLAELETLYRTAPLGLCLMDTDLRYLRCNEKLAEINGIPAADHIGRALREIVPEIADTMEPVYRRVIQSGEPVLNVAATGATPADPKTTRHFSASYYPVKSEDGVVRGVSSIVEEITQRKNEEQDRRRLQDELAQLGQVGTLGEMAATLAHELNQPLAAIGNYAAGSLNLLKAADADSPDVREALEHIARLTRRAGEITHRIRGLVRKEPHRSSARPNDLIREVVELVEFGAQAKAVNIELDLTDELPLVVVDRIQIQQVIVNLVQNALDAMTGIDRRAGKLVIQTRATSVGTVQVAVSDMGSGLPEGSDEKIFEPFFTTKPDGLGLGLGISRSIIEAHGGRLWSQPQTKGATFLFTLPVAVPATVVPQPPSDE